MTSLPLIAALALTSAQAPATNVVGPEAGPAGRFLLGAKVGYFKSTSPLQGAAYLGGEVGYITPLLNDRLAIVAEFDYHEPQVSGTLMDPQIGEGSGTYTLTEREMALLLSAVYRFQGALGSVTPYLGAGPGLYLHRATAAAFGQNVVESEGTVGFQFLGGAEMKLGPGGLFAEAHYHFTRIGFLSTGNVNVGGFLAASAGYRLHF